MTLTQISPKAIYIGNKNTTGHTTKKVYMRPNGVEEQIWPEDFVAYYKFNGNLLDSSGYNHDAINIRGSTSYTTVSGNNEAIVCSGNVFKAGINQKKIVKANRTISFWVYQSGAAVMNDARVMGGLGVNGVVTHVGLWKNHLKPNTSSTYETGVYLRQSNPESRYLFEFNFDFQEWYNIIFTIDDSLQCRCYVNNNQVGSVVTIRASTSQDFIIGNNYSASDSQFLPGYLDEIIFDDKVRDSNERSNYFNNIKSDYGY